MLTKSESIFLLIMTIPIMGHVIILPLMIDVAGRDSWIAVLVSLPFAFVFAYAIYRLRRNKSKRFGNELMEEILGKRLGKIVIFLFIAYFLFLTILSFSALVDLVYIVFLPETPQIALIIWFAIFFIYASKKGIKRIAITAGILTFIGLITGHTVTLLDTPNKDWRELTPILEFGWSPVLWGALIIISIWVELLLLLFLPLRNTKEKRLFLVWSIAIILIALTMNSTTTGAITIFGLEQADNFLYPATEIVRIIQLGFIDRFDTYAMILMTLGTYIRCSLFFRFSYDLSVIPFTKKRVRWFVGILLILFVILATYYVTKEHYRLEKLVHYYTFFIVFYPIPFILLFISRFKRKRPS